MSAEIFDAIKTCIIAIIAGCVSLKLVTGTIFDITPLKINLSDRFIKKSEVKQINDNLEILLDNIAEIDAKINSIDYTTKETSNEINKINKQLEEMNSKINKNKNSIKEINGNLIHVASKERR